MSVNDDFYLNFPSLNQNSQESQRYKRISREYTDYMKNVSPISPKQTKTQQRRYRSQQTSEVSSPVSSVASNPSMDVIFSAEDRNRYEDEQVKSKKKVYQESLQRQIEEQKMKKAEAFEKRKRDEMILEQRLIRQLESIQLEKKLAQEKVVERISLSENEKESYKDSNISQHNISSTSSNNDVYRYFSRSAKRDSDLFNYKKYFTDIMLEQKNQESIDVEFPETKKIAKAMELALKKVEPQKKPEINNCPSCSPSIHTECSRCRKKLEIYCKECNEENEKASPETTNRLEIEYNEPELQLPFSNDQQVVIYRPGDQHAPYSFNIEPDSKFYKDKLEELRNETEMKLAKYLKHYGSLRKENMKKESVKLEEIDAQPIYTGTIPKWKPLIQNAPPKNLTLTPTSNNSELDDILSNAQYTMITQVGFAKKQLELEKRKV